MLNTKYRSHNYSLMKIVYRSALSLIFILLVLFSAAQLPDTEIYLAAISKTEKDFTFGPAENITNRVGYDNQPSFSPDNTKLLFVRVLDSVQSDVVEFSFSNKSTRQLTNTNESEYSPTYTPDHSKISVVRVDSDTAQRFYLFDPATPTRAIHVPGTDSIGYFCWLNDSLLAMFLVSEPFSLNVLNLKDNTRRFIAHDVGRCLKLSADKSSLLFVDKADSANWIINRYNFTDFSIKQICPTLKRNEDFSPLPDGSLIMGDEGKLYRRDIHSKEGWKMVMDYQNSIGPFYRITVNENGTRIAFVAYAGIKP